MVDIIFHAKPRALFGLSRAGPSFEKAVVEEVCKHSERPLILFLTNPTSKAEITAEHGIHLSEGKAIFAIGSPFPLVGYNGKIIELGKANSVFVFGSAGFGAVNVEVNKITDEMLVAASKALVKSVFP